MNCVKFALKSVDEMNGQEFEETKHKLSIVSKVNRKNAFKQNLGLFHNPVIITLNM